MSKEIKGKVCIIYHRADFDGVFGGAIVRHFYETCPSEEVLWEATMVGYNYGDPDPDLDSLIDNYDVVYMVDISLPPPQMRYLYEQGCDLVWIDHHITAIDAALEHGYADLPGKRDSNNYQAGCELAWEFLYPGTEVPQIIQYLSAYDVWDMARFDWENDVLPLQLALKAEYGVSEYAISQVFSDLLGTPLESIISPGRLIRKFQQRQWKSACRNYSFPITVAGQYKGICMMSTEFSSNLFESVAANYDMMCVVNKRGSIYGLSLYIAPDKLPEFSAGEYLKAVYGGGGHKGAAGCQIDFDTFTKLIEGGVI